MSRDELSLIRTHLANERTVLSYIRTSLAFLAAGAGLIHFIPTLLSAFFGWGLIIIGAFVLGVGLVRFVLVRRRMKLEAPN